MNQKEARYFGGKKLYIVPRICRPKCCGHNITSMKKLSKETIQLISSTQVITSVYSAVKELVENSIDAGSTNIEVRLVSIIPIQYCRYDERKCSNVA